MGEILNNIRQEIHQNKQQPLPEDVGTTVRDKWYLPTNTIARASNIVANLSVIGTGVVFGAMAETALPVGVALGAVVVGQSTYDIIKDKSRNKTFNRVAPELRTYFERFGVIMTDKELMKFFKFLERAQIGEQKRINLYSKGLYSIFCKNETTFIIEQLRSATETTLPVKASQRSEQVLHQPENLFTGELKEQLNNIDILINTLTAAKDSLSIESQHLLERAKTETIQVTSDYSKLVILGGVKPEDTENISKILEEKETSLLKAKEDLTSSLRNNLNVHKSYSNAQLDELK